MDFDFHKQYAHYTIRQLLEIVENSGQYQAAAVAAASELLQQKDAAIVADEKERMHTLPQRLEQSSEASIFDESGPVFNPRHVATVRILLAAALVFLGAKVIWRMIPFLRSFGTIDAAVGLAMLIAPVLSVLFYLGLAVLIWRKVALGWYLAMIVAVFGLVSQIGSILFVLNSDIGFFLPGLLLTNGLDLVIHGLIVALLWIAVTRDTFRITDRNRNWTTFGTLALAAAFELYRNVILLGHLT